MADRCIAKTEVRRSFVSSGVISPVSLALVTLVSFFSISAAHALGLGQIRVLSSQGEPLKAEIPITSISAEEASSLVIGIASQSDHRREGLAFNHQIESLKISYDLTNQRPPVIRIQGDKPVQENFLDLLIDAQWHAGHIQRSYTMLIHQPAVLHVASPDSAIHLQGNASLNHTLSDQSVQTHIVTMPSGVVIRERYFTQDDATTNAESLREQQALTPAVTERVTVLSGQTLGKIASTLKPSGVTQEQMLAALYWANPEAFIQSNINWLKTGAVLRIPSKEEIAAISQTDAQNLVSLHARQFNERRLQAAQNNAVVSSKSGTGGQGTVTQTSVSQTNTEARDVLVVNAADSRAADQAIAASQQEQEELIRRTEVENLQKELNALKGEVSELKGELEGKEIEIAKLSANAEEELGNVASSDAGSAQADSSQAEVIQTYSQQSEANQEGVPQAAHSEANAGGLDTTSGAETVLQNLFKQVRSNPMLLFAAFSALAFLFVLILLSRRGKDGKATQPAVLLLEDARQKSPYPPSQLKSDFTISPLQEADIFLEYGLSEQAADVLKSAIASEPTQVAFYIKLCEILLEQKDITAFDEYATRLQALMKQTDREWERVTELARQTTMDGLPVRKSPFDHLDFTLDLEQPASPASESGQKKQ